MLSLSLISLFQQGVLFYVLSVLFICLTLISQVAMLFFPLLFVVPPVGVVDQRRQVRGGSTGRAHQRHQVCVRETTQRPGNDHFNGLGKGW